MRNLVDAKAEQSTESGRYGASLPAPDRLGPENTTRCRTIRVRIPEVEDLLGPQKCAAVAGQVVDPQVVETNPDIVVVGMVPLCP